MMKFTCPSCGGNKIECIQDACILCTPVRVEDDGEVVYELDSMSVEDAHIDRFQCQNCGWALPVSDDVELVDYLNQEAT
jgi:hypothetical protein